MHTVSSPEAAEATKLLENTFRAVNIAFVNEFADSCTELGLDATEVSAAAATKPYGFLPFRPGPGVGGHCIPCDPHYLLWQMRARRVPLPGYDWVAGGLGETVTYSQATRRAAKYDASVRDGDSGSAPHFTYADERGRHHDVWFEDALSSAAKLELVERYDLGGAFFWRLDGEDPRTWELIDLG